VHLDWWQRFKNACLSEPREVMLDHIIGTAMGYSMLNSDWTPRKWTPANSRACWCSIHLATEPLLLLLRSAGISPSAL
jgi:hypothetical protein